MGSLFLAVALIICARWFFRSDLSDAVAEALRRKHGVAVDPAVVERVEELTERMEEEFGNLRGEVVELSERLEFAERLLIDVRRREGLPEPHST